MWEDSLTLVSVVFLLVAFVLLWRWFWRPKIWDGGAMHIAFVHPDLGIGGAERLVVDAAVALQQKGHRVTIYTARHVRTHCFEETRDGTLDVQVRGNFWCRHIFGRFYAACAYWRMIWVSLCIVVGNNGKYQVLFVDQVSVCIPVLRWARAHGVIFYCHFPDFCLADHRSLVKRIYRAPLDFCEELATGFADLTFVNSEFTNRVVAESFPRLTRRGWCPKVLYPPLNLKDQDINAGKAAVKLDLPIEGKQLLVSINRFERKKNVGLAIRAVAALPESLRAGIHLVIAGGYDKEVPENIEYAAELETLAKTLEVSGVVTQMHSVSSTMKATLLKHAICLLYTPNNEHFGIVPLEAMHARVPVLAVNSGGPLESVVDGLTGRLRPPQAEPWAEALCDLIEDGDLRKSMGEEGRKRVTQLFSLEAFGLTLDQACRDLTRGKFKSQ